MNYENLKGSGSGTTEILYKHSLRETEEYREELQLV
jgi:hypothetical protein